MVQDGRLRRNRRRKLYVDKEHGDEASDYTEPHFVVDNKPYNWEECPIAWLKYNEEELPLCYYIKDLIDDINWQTSVTSDVLRDVAKFIYILRKLWRTRPGRIPEKT